ncbi:hypothetical protein D3C83_16500 [compost metagenome]
MWLKPDGTEMSDEEWRHDFARCLGVMLGGQAMSEVDARGRPISDSDFLLLFNGHHEEIAFTLPNHAESLRWMTVLDTTHEHGLARGGVYAGGSAYRLKGRSLALLQKQEGIP